MVTCDVDLFDLKNPMLSPPVFSGLSSNSDNDSNIRKCFVSLSLVGGKDKTKGIKGIVNHSSLCPSLSVQTTSYIKRCEYTVLLFFLDTMSLETVSAIINRVIREETERYTEISKRNFYLIPFHWVHSRGEIKQRDTKRVLLQ